MTEQFRFQQGFVGAAQLTLPAVFRYVRYWRESPGDTSLPVPNRRQISTVGFRWRDEGDFTAVLRRRAFTDHTELAGDHRRSSASILCVCASTFSSVAC
ncbi:hypothetical protein ACLK19_26970 [Escherichia coli]